MKINFLGDSITEGAMAGHIEKRYATLVANALGAEECNFGVCGTRIAKQVRKTLNPDDDVYMCRAVKMPKDAAFTFVFGGTNDYGHGDAKMGTMDSRDPYTFYGAMHELVSYLVSAFDRKKLCFILPLPRFDQDNVYGDGSKTEPAYPLSAYLTAEKEVLDYYGVEYLDLTDKFYVPTTREDDGDLFSDGLHPNAAGHSFLAACLIVYVRDKI